MNARRVCFVLALLPALAFAAGDRRAAPAAALERASALIRDGQLDAAERALRRLVRRYPSDPAAYNDLGVLHAQKGDFEQAREWLERAIATSASYDRIFRNLQQVLGAHAAQAYQRALTGKQDEQAPVRLALLGTAGDTKLAAATRPATHRPSSTLTRSKPAAVAPAVSVKPAPPAAKAAQRDKPPKKQAGRSSAKRERIKGVEATVDAWARAWSARDVDAYLEFYGSNFTPPANLTTAAWRAQRHKRLTRPKFIKVSVSNLRVSLPARDRAVVTFRQRYQSNVLRSSATKELQLARLDGGWKIVKETVKR